jgi:CBS domain-containing protein
MPTAREHMSRDLLTVEATLPLAEVADRMVAREVGAVLVLRSGRLAGILTERDVLRAVARGIRDDAVVGDWMTADPETIEPDDTTDHAATLMMHGGFRHLPVVERGEVVGIVSIRDLMRIALADSAPRGV